MWLHVTDRVAALERELIEGLAHVVDERDRDGAVRLTRLMQGQRASLLQRQVGCDGRQPELEQLPRLRLLRLVRLRGRSVARAVA